MLKWLRTIDWTPILASALILQISLSALPYFFPHTEAPYRQTNANANNEIQNQNYGPWWIRLVSLEAIFTGVIAVFASLQYRESRVASARQLRAYLAIVSIEPDCPNMTNAAYDTPNPLPPGFLPVDSVRLTIRNNGQTPAHSVAAFLNWQTIPPFSQLPLGAALPNYVTANDIANSSRQFLDSEREFPHSIWIRTSLQPFRQAIANQARLMFYGWIEYTDIFETRWNRQFRFVWQPNKTGPDHLYPDREGNSERRVD